MTGRRWETFAVVLSQQHNEAGGSLIREMTVRVASSPDNAGTDQHYRMVRVRQARQDGVREEPVLKLLKSPASSNPVDSGWYAVRTNMVGLCWELRCGLRSLASEATMNVCGVVVAMPQGHSWAPPLPTGSQVFVGTIVRFPIGCPSQGRQVGLARRQPMALRWGGGAVVVRAGESLAHGEGLQRIDAAASHDRSRW